MSEAIPVEKGAITNPDAPEGTTVTPSVPSAVPTKPVSKSSSTKPPSKVASEKPISKSAVAQVNKGKGKRTAEEADFEERNAREKKRVEAKAAADKRAAQGEFDDDDDEEDEEDEEEEGEDESDEEVEESFEEIDPSAIRSRRTRGVKIDYTSPEALAKAGLKPGEADDDD